MTARSRDIVVVVRPGSVQPDVLQIRVVWTVECGVLSLNVTCLKSQSGLQTRGFLGQLALNKPGKTFSTIKSFRNIKCC